MTDFLVLPFEFNDTTITVECVTDAAKKRMNGACSLQVRKSASVEFVDRLIKEGFTFNLS